MPRKTHRDPKLARDTLTCRMHLTLPQRMRSFLELEAKRLSEERGKVIADTDVVKALITAYYEKRMASLLVSPDD